MTNAIEIENPDKKRNKHLHNFLLALRRIAYWAYGIIFWITLTAQIIFSVSMWESNIHEIDFCGNLFAAAWAIWFIISLGVGLLLLPGEVWAIKHSNKQIRLIFLLGFTVYLTIFIVTVVITLA